MGEYEAERRKKEESVDNIDTFWGFELSWNIEGKIEEYRIKLKVNNIDKERKWIERKQTRSQKYVIKTIKIARIEIKS